jgi:hypothetical protein
MVGHLVGSFDVRAFHSRTLGEIVGLAELISKLTHV